MKYQKRRRKRTVVLTAAVCLLAVCLSACSIYFTYQLHKTSSMIYAHPYTVSNESRAMRSRLLDMRNFLIILVAGPDSDWAEMRQLLNDRYAMQYAAIERIAEQYLGPEEDVAQLRAAMQTLEDTQTRVLPSVLSLDQEITVQYLEQYIYPAYDAVDNALTKVIDFADNKVQGLEQHSAEVTLMATISAGMLTVFLPAFFLFVFWRERKSIREIRYRENLFDVLSSNVDEVFFIFNQKEHALEYISANCKRVLGIEADAFLKNPDILTEKVVAQDQEKLKEFTRNIGTTSRKSCDVRICISGKTLWIGLQCFPEVVRGRVVRYIVSVGDQTQARLREQALKDALLNAQNANAAKQNFLSRMSHEIRTPMNAIIGMTTIAAAYIEDQKRVADCLEKIGYSSKHLMTLINDVLDMSKIDEGKMTLSHEPFNLESVAASITSIIYPQAEEKGIAFTMPLVDVTQTMLIGDALRLNQILLNLLSNALKFTPAGGTVRLEIRQIQKKNGRVRLRFCVSDTGIGMDEAFVDRIFIPFEQASAATGQKYGGTGLGMSICKNLVTLMGGTIQVKSKLEQGTTFTVELDFEMAQHVEQTAPVLEALKVLVADDDRDSCIHTTLLLENLGIVSAWVLTGVACVEEVLHAHKNGEAYDVCLIDWKMPDIDGIEVTRRVREAVGPDTTIIIITAYDWSAIEQRAREAGANAFLSKPIFASTLYNTLLSVTGIEKTVRANTNTDLHPALKGRRVLLAEDNELNREIAVELLKMTGMEVDCVCNGQEAVRQFTANGDMYDVILMDVQMPVMNGYQATQAIRKSGHARAQTIPILAMTADAFHEDVIKATEAGMNGHLAKPIDAHSLYQIIEHCLELTAEEA